MVLWLNVGVGGCSDGNGGCSELCVNGESGTTASRQCLCADGLDTQYSDDACSRQQPLPGQQTTTTTTTTAATLS